MPTAALDDTRIDMREPLAPEEIEGCAVNPTVRVMQASSPLAPSTWRRLNDLFFARRPDVELRVYGFYSEPCDLSFCSAMTNVRRFAADCLRDASGIHHIAELRNLETLSLGIFEASDFEVLRDVAPTIQRLSLGATRSRKPDLAPLARFSGLIELQLEGQQRNIEVLSQLTTLEDVTLRSISTSGIDYLQPLSRMWSLDVKLGGIRDFSAIHGMGGLRYLELWQVRGLSHLGMVSHLPGLQNLFLQSLPNVRCLPDLRKAKSLRRIVLQNMRGMMDFSALQRALVLQEFLLLQGNKTDPAALEPVLRNPSLRSAAAYFGSRKKNAAFETSRQCLGIAHFEWTPFEYY